MSNPVDLEAAFREWWAAQGYAAKPNPHTVTIASAWASTLLPPEPATADGPAVPEGREPAAVVGEPKSPPDWRGLCEELVEALDGWHQAVFETGVGWVRPDETYLLDRARAALARWGSPNLAELRRSLGDPVERQAAPVPVAVSERLPGAEDCLDEGWAWFFSPRVGWRQAVLPVSAAYTHWLPAHALPLPSGEVEA